MVCFGRYCVKWWSYKGRLRHVLCPKGVLSLTVQRGGDEGGQRILRSANKQVCSQQDTPWVHSTIGSTEGACGLLFLFRSNVTLSVPELQSGSTALRQVKWTQKWLSVSHHGALRGLQLVMAEVTDCSAELMGSRHGLPTPQMPSKTVQMGYYALAVYPQGLIPLGQTQVCSLRVFERENTFLSTFQELLLPLE